MNEGFKKDYFLLTQRLQENTRLGGVMGILHWDQEVIMPSGAAESRSKQMGVLAGIMHEKSTDPEIGKLLDSLNGDDSFNSFEKCNIYAFEKKASYSKNNCLMEFIYLY